MVDDVLKVVGLVDELVDDKSEIIVSAVATAVSVISVIGLVVVTSLVSVTVVDDKSVIDVLGVATASPVISVVGSVDDISAVSVIIMVGDASVVGLVLGSVTSVVSAGRIMDGTVVATVGVYVRLLYDDVSVVKVVDAKSEDDTSVVSVTVIVGDALVVSVVGLEVVSEELIVACASVSVERIMDDASVLV